MTPTFENPLMLSAAGAAVMPLVLHWLSRLRYRQVRFPAMMFLQTDQTPSLRRGRTRGGLLLGVRMGALLLVAVALAGPVLVPSPLQAPASLLVLIIDVSASMEADDAGRSRLDQAKQQALSILAAIDPQDRVALLTAPPDNIPTVENDIQSVSAAIARLEVRPRAADLPAALARARTLAQGNPKTRVLLISDAQATSLVPLLNAGAASFDVELIQVGSGLGHNVSVESVELVRPPAVRGVATTLRVVVRNQGPARDDLRIRLAQGSATLDARPVTIDADSTWVWEPTFTPARAGPTVVSVEVGPDSTSFDNTYHLPLDVREPLDVVILSDSPRVGGGFSWTPASQAFALALQPFARGGRNGQDLASVRATTPRRWLLERQADLVVLCDRVTLDAATVEALRRHVFEGGGLLVMPWDVGFQAVADILWADGEGLMPVRVGGRSNQPMPLRTPAGGEFVWDEPSGSDLSIRRFVRPIDLTPDAVVHLTLADGTPLLVTRQPGRGRVVWFGSSIGGVWNDLPSDPRFVSLARQIALKLAKRPQRSRSVLVGEPLTFEIINPPEPSVVLLSPDGRWRRINLTLSGQVGEFRYARTSDPGVYTLRQRGRPDTHFVVRLPPEQSRLESAGPQLLTRLESLGVRLADAPAAVADRPDRRRTALAPWVLTAAVLLMAAEMLLLRGRA